MTSPKLDEAVRAMSGIFAGVADAVVGGWSLERGDATAAVTAVPVPTLNAVRVLGPSVSAGDVSSLLADVAAAGFPYSLQTREPVGAGLAQDRDMVLAGAVPFMLLEELAPCPMGDLHVRRLPTGSLSEHNRLLERGFEVPAGMFSVLDDANILDGGTTAYIGSIAGEDVTTGLGIRLGDFIAVLNIATPPAHRRCGYGAAITQRIVADGLAEGASSAILQSSDAGFKIYERLGFQHLESWQIWMDKA